MDETFVDSLDLMDIGFSFDGFEKIYQDLGKACEVKKLIQISSKCLNFAKKVADEVAADWFDTDLDASESIFKKSPINEELKGSDKLDYKINENSSDNSKLNNTEDIKCTVIQSDNKVLLPEEKQDMEICIPNEIYEPSTSQDYSSNIGASTGTSTKMNGTTTNCTNLVDFLKPHEFDIGGFDDIDLQDEWDDDVDYDIALASYHQSNNKNNLFKIKAAAKFISKLKLRRSKKIGTQISEITELPLNASKEPDWELL